MPCAHQRAEPPTLRASLITVRLEVRVLPGPIVQQIAAVSQRTSDYRVRPGRAARAACLQPEPECLCGALGQVGEGGVPVQGDPLWRALAAASAERICRTFPCRAESPREGQCPAVPSECKHPPRRACSMPRATGRPVALLPSGGSVTACQPTAHRPKQKAEKQADKGRAARATYAAAHTGAGRVAASI